MLRKCFLFLCFFATAFASTAEKERKLDVLTLSALILDHYFFISDEQLKAITPEKGGWMPIDFPALMTILDKSKGAAKLVAGGSGANVIKALSQLGKRCALIGKVGCDEKGKYYRNRIDELGITSYLEEGPLHTGQAVCFITPDGERTFRTYLGASHSLSDLTLDEELFKSTRHFHVEGYQLVDRDLAIRALKLAREAGATISMDLANVEIVRRNKTFINGILDKYIDVLFCNEREAKILTGLSACEAVDRLSNLCDVVVVTMSERGSWARKGNEKVFMEALSVNSIDTTGAGDLYAAGFLNAYLDGKPLKQCAFEGSFIAAQVVKRLGAELPPEIWEEIRADLAEEDEAFNQPKDLAFVK